MIRNLGNYILSNMMKGQLW